MSEQKYYSNIATIEEQQIALYSSYMNSAKVAKQNVMTDTHKNLESNGINKLNVITDVFLEVKKFCMDTFKNPLEYIQDIFECRLARQYSELLSNVVINRHIVYYDSILMSLTGIFESSIYKMWIPTYKNHVDQAKIFDTVDAKIISEVENKRLLNLRNDFEDLIEYRRLWIIRIHLKLRELHKNPLYIARSKLQGKKRQYKNFLEAVEKYHLRDTAMKVSKTADVSKKLEVYHKNHIVKKQILWLQWTIANNNIPKIDSQLERYERAILINEDYQTIMNDIKDLREENKLFQRQKKQFEQIFGHYKIFQNVAVWECMNERHKIILAYPKVTL